MLTGKRFGFLLWVCFFFLSLFQLSRSLLCSNRKLHGEVAALHTEKSLQMVYKPLQRVSSNHQPGWSETRCYMACTSALLLHLVKNKKFRICGRAWHLPLLELNHRKHPDNAVEHGQTLVFPPFRTLPGMATLIYRSGIHLAETHILSECLSQYRDQLQNMTVVQNCQNLRKHKGSSTLQNESAKVRPCALHKHQKVRALWKEVLSSGQWFIPVTKRQPNHNGYLQKGVMEVTDRTF